MNYLASELYNLIEKRMPDILVDEAVNRLCIHLYYAGRYWVAFEKSAFNLCSVYGKAIINPMKILTAPFPIVMASIDGDSIASAMRNLQCRERSVKELVYEIGGTANDSTYHQWHKRKVSSIMAYYGQGQQ